MLKALPGFALIELPTKYESGLKTEKEKYELRSEGIFIDGMFIKSTADEMTQSDYDHTYGEAKNKTVYFAPFEDGEVVRDQDKKYVFIAIRSLRGVKDAEA